ncbi:MAG TPA: BON domain-containing protein [Opitutaceae bacterium]|nr:BON domain-containing protein [Opitutaceae bacterium]
MKPIVPRILSTFAALALVASAAAGDAAPDNTSRNKRDRADAAVTPMSQGNSQADVNTSAKIRRELMAADRLSTNAKNVKVITQNGRVTLRGPVETPAEKQLIGEIAGRIARRENVDNQLEVNTDTPVSPQ